MRNWTVALASLACTISLSTVVWAQLPDQLTSRTGATSKIVDGGRDTTPASAAAAPVKLRTLPPGADSSDGELFSIQFLGGGPLALLDVPVGQRFVVTDLQFNDGGKGSLVLTGIGGPALVAPVDPSGGGFAPAHRSYQTGVVFMEGDTVTAQTDPETLQVTIMGKLVPNP